MITHPMEGFHVSKSVMHIDVGLQQGDFIFGLFRGRYWGEEPFWKRWTVMKVVSGEGLDAVVKFLYPYHNNCWNSKVQETGRVQLLAFRKFKLIFCDDFWITLWRDIKEDFKFDGYFKRNWLEEIRYGKRNHS